MSAEPTSSTTPEGGQPGPADFSVSALPPAPAPPLGALSAPIELPAELARPLTKREQAVARALATGITWQQACSVARVPPRAELRQRSPRPAIVAAAEYLTSEMAIRCGMSKYWVIQNCVALYRRACQAEPVLGPAGWPTGQYRFDGATAARMLQMLGEDIGMFGKGKTPGLGVDQVAALLDAVAARGRRQLEPDRGRLVGESSSVPRGTTAPQQIGSTETKSGDSGAST